MNQARHGFSLIELMITMTLCVLVITLTAVNVSFLQRGTARSEMEKLFAICMYVQQRALSSGRQLTLEFDEGHSSYRFDGRTEKFASAVRFGVPPGVKGPPSQPTSIIKSAITFPGKKIVFYPDGVISSGIAYITDQKYSTVYALSNAVAQVSYLRKYGYTNSWKLLA